ncbi:MAG: GerMN domain-containing protein [Clostridiaceae bacterium]|jgi:germination protein M|nr:GerMN domain-containing protein [Clostridiaceae bacterium]
MKKFRVIAVIMVLALLMCSCGKDKNNEDVMGDDLTPISSLTIDEEEAAVLNEKVPVVLYFGNEQQNKLVKEIRYVDIKEAKKGAETLASAMVKELLKGPKAEGLTPLIAEGTTLRSPVTISERIAKVDLTKEFIENHPGGKELAELTVYSIVNTLTEMKEIERVKITINGKETKNFKDNVTLNNDFPRNDAVVNKEVGLARPEDGGLEPVDATSEDESIEISNEEDEDPLE